ncbi:MAG: hypothetical protein RR060_08145, partial [Victivallaceae bacterium]
MKNKFAQNLIIAIIIALVLLAVAGPAAWYEYNGSQNGPIELSSPWVWKSPTLKVGESVSGNMKISAPWGQEPTGGRVDWKSGITGGELEIKRVETNYLTGIYELKLTAIPYRAADFESAGTLQLNYPAEFSKKVPPELTIIHLPGLKSLMPDKLPDNELTLAGLASPPGSKWNILHYLTGLAAILIVGVIIYVIIRSRRHEEQLTPPWIIAERELTDLRTRVAGHPELVVPGVVKVSDIVRGYLDERFHWSTTRQTAAEFLLELTKGDSPLSLGHRKSLKNFVYASELVKFAGEHPTVEMLDTAIDEAIALVEDTK